MHGNLQVEVELESLGVVGDHNLETRLLEMTDFAYYDTHLTKEEMENSPKEIHKGQLVIHDNKEPCIEGSVGKGKFMLRGFRERNRAFNRSRLHFEIREQKFAKVVAVDRQRV